MMARQQRRPKDQAIIDEAERMSQGDAAHRPLWGVEYRPGVRMYAAQCAGCEYWTGNVTKTAAARMILSHARSHADEPAMSAVEVAEARLAGLRKEKRQIYGRGAARKKEAANVRIRYAEMDLEVAKKMAESADA